MDVIVIGVDDEVIGSGYAKLLVVVILIKPDDDEVILSYAVLLPDLFFGLGLVKIHGLGASIHQLLFWIMFGWIGVQPIKFGESMLFSVGNGISCWYGKLGIFWSFAIWCSNLGSRQTSMGTSNWL